MQMAQRNGQHTGQGFGEHSGKIANKLLGPYNKYNVDFNRIDDVQKFILFCGIEIGQRIISNVQDSQENDCHIFTNTKDVCEMLSQALVAFGYDIPFTASQIIVIV
jgi:hypothetical protein